MRPPFSRSSTLCLAFTTLCLLPPDIRAVTFQSVPSPNLDLSHLGSVLLAGDFDSISLYQYVGQNEDGLNSNGSQSLLSRYPSGAFADISSADAYIESMCPYWYQNGSLIGVVVGGNFTSLGGQQAQAIALFDPDTREVTPLPGLSGQVSTVLCDNAQQTVYVGGNFNGANSTNAIAWTTGWTNLPFAGFNGPVAAITKLPNGNIGFGGRFTGIGNTASPTTPNAQTVNLGSANITAGPTTTLSGFTDPRNIICKTSEQAPAGNEWLLQDKTPGFWQANLGFVFNPTKLRLYNSETPGYGTKTWRYTALPLDGILEFYYYNATGQKLTCSNQCPLPQNNNTYQDFYFVNVIPMNAFRIDISDWYDIGAGLGGVELFEDEIFSFAINSFNEPLCDHVSNGSSSTNSGPWQINPMLSSSSEYLTAFLPEGTGPTTDVSVVFQPDIKQSGNYSIIMYTPGCLADDTCATRGTVNVTGQMGTLTGTATVPISVELSQTNNYDKFDQVYYGYVDANTDTFRPTITLAPSLNQLGRPLTVVAQRVRFDLVESSGGLNGLFEFAINQATVNTDFSSSPLDSIGSQLSSGANILAFAEAGNLTYVGGAFTASAFSNIFATSDGNPISLPGGGLNAPVQTLFPNASYIYVGGNFTNTRANDTSGLNHVAAYSLDSESWQSLGAGVNGIVSSIVPVVINVTQNQAEEVVAVSGWFTEVLGFAQYASFSAENIAIWVPSHQNWLHNLGTGTISLIGRINAQTFVPGQDPLLSGAIDSQVLGSSGVAALTTSGGLSLQQIPLTVQPQQSTSLSPTKKRATSQAQVNGVTTALFYDQNGLNITAFGGHFSAQATNGSIVENLVLLNGSNSDAVTGLAAGNLSSAAAILAMDVQGTTLFAGGSIAGGILAYDLVLADLSSVQPPALSGDDAVVNDVATQPSASQVYVGGSFTSAGSLPCPALCIYDTSQQRWTAPNTGLSADSEVSQMAWGSKTRLIVAGNLTINGNFTTLASWDTTAQTMTPFTGAGSSSAIPGAVTAFTAVTADYSQFFVAGTATSNGTAFLSKYDGSNWIPVNGNLGSLTRIEGLQVLQLSQPHTTNNVISAGQTLLLTGQLEIPGFGNASAALYDGSSFVPFALSTMNDGSPGSVRRAVASNPQAFLTLPGSGHLALGFIVLIGLAIALALTFLLILIGIFAERLRRRREGYVPAPTDASTYEKQVGAVGNIPSEKILGGVVGGRPSSRNSVAPRL